MKGFTKKIVSERKEMSENLNDTRSKTELGSVKDPLKIHRTAPNERALVSESPNIINEVNVIIAPGQKKQQL